MVLGLLFYNKKRPEKLCFLINLYISKERAIFPQISCGGAYDRKIMSERPDRILRARNKVNNDTDIDDNDYIEDSDSDCEEDEVLCSFLPTDRFVNNPNS